MRTKYQNLNLFAIVVLLILCSIFIGNYANLDFLIYDDAYYYLDLVQDGNILNPTTDGVNPSTGYHPLWYVLLEMLSIIGILGYFAITVLVSLVILLSYYVWCKVFRTMIDAYSAVLSSLLMHVYLPILLLNFSGMEAPLVMMAIGMFLHCAIQYIQSWGVAKYLKVTPLMMSIVVLFLARTDMVIIIIPMMTYVCFAAWKKDKNIISKSRKPFRRTIIAYLITFNGMILAYLGFNKLITGVWTQTSTTVYSTIRWSDVYSSADFLSAYWLKVVEQCKVNYLFTGDFHLSFILFIVVIVAAMWKLPTVFKVYFIANLLYFLFHAGARFCMSAWYVIPYFTLFCLSLASFVSVSYSKAVSYTAITIAFIMMFVSSLTLIEDIKNQKSDYTAFTTWTKADRPLDQIECSEALFMGGYPYKIGGYNTGEFAYKVPGIVNLDGLMNVNIVKAYSKNEGIKYLKDNEIYLLIDSEMYFYIFRNFISLDSLELVSMYRSNENKEKATTRLYMLKSAPFTKEQVREWLVMGH